MKFLTNTLRSCFRKSHLLIRVAGSLLLIAAASPVFADGGLFSEVAMDSVFGSSATSKASVETASEDASIAEGVIPKLTSNSRLLELVKEFQSDATMSDESGFDAVSLMARADGWAFPATVAVNVNRQEITFRLTLVTLKTEDQIPTSKLLRLMSTSRQEGSTRFLHDPDTQQLIVVGSLSFRDVTSGKLLGAANQIASFAAASADLWSTPDVQSGDARPENTSDELTETASDSQAKAALSLSGRWSATLSDNSAMAIELTDDSSFALVHLDQGKPTISNGRYKLVGNQLTLSAEGTAAVVSEIKQENAAEFSMRLGTTDVVFKRQN